MKQLLISSLLLILLSGQALAQTVCTNFPADLTDPNYNIEQWLGSGYDGIRQRIKVIASCLNGQKAHIPNQSAELSVGLLTNYQEINREIERSSEGKIKVGWFSFGKNKSFIQKIISKKYTQTFVLAFDINTGNGRFDIDPSNPLNDLAHRVKYDACEFKKYCGDSFVFQTTEGVKLLVTIQISFSSYSHYEEYKKGFNAGVEGSIEKTFNLPGSCCTKVPLPINIDFSGSFSKSLSELNKTLIQQGRIDVFAHQDGGDVAQLGAILGANGATGSCSLDNRQACLQMVDNALNYIRTPEFISGAQNNPGVLSHLRRPYWEVDPDVPDMPSELTPEIENARQQLAQELDSRLADQATIQETLQLNLSMQRQQQLDHLMATLETEIQAIQQAGLVCFSDLVSCPKQAENVLSTLVSYDKKTIEPNMLDGQVLYYPFTHESQSIQLINGSKPFAAEIYGDNYFQNPWYMPQPQVIVEDTPQIANDVASSSIVYMGCILTLFHNINYQGGFAFFPEGLYPELAKTPIGNDTASSARLKCADITETTLDISGNQYHGAVYGAQMTSEGYSFSPRSFIDIPNSNKLSPSYLTISSWINPANNKGAIVGRVSNAADHQYALMLDAGKPHIYVRLKNGWYSATTINPIPLNEWSFITGVWDGTTLSIYVNGVLQGSRQGLPAGELDKFDTASTRIGLWWYKDPSYYSGKMDDVRIFERGLNESEVSALYESRNKNPNQPPLAIFSIKPTMSNTFSLDASLSSDADGNIISYQWQTDQGQMINGKTTSLTLNSAGTYTLTLTVTDDKGATSTAQKTIVIADSNDIPTPTSRLINISANAKVPVIGGFGISGSGSLQVMLRGMGVDSCIDTEMVLQKYPSGEIVDSNANWESHSSAAQISALPSHLQLPKATDAGMLVTLPVGYYTVSVNSTSCIIGNAVIGLDAIDTAGTAYLANISANAPVPIIGGFGINGTSSLPLMLRGLGINTCMDPTILLQTYPNGTIAGNSDNWTSHSSFAQISSLPSHLQPIQSTDAGMYQNTNAGYYTITVNSNGCQDNAVVGVDLVQ